MNPQESFLVKKGKIQWDAIADPPNFGGLYAPLLHGVTPGFVPYALTDHSWVNSNIIADVYGTKVHQDTDFNSVFSTFSVNGTVCVGVKAINDSGASVPLALHSSDVYITKLASVGIVHSSAAGLLSSSALTNSDFGNLGTASYLPYFLATGMGNSLLTTDGTNYTNMAASKQLTFGGYTGDSFYTGLALSTYDLQIRALKDSTSSITLLAGKCNICGNDYRSKILLNSTSVVLTATDAAGQSDKSLTVTQADGLTVSYMDAGIVHSSAGGVLSSSAILSSELPAHGVTVGTIPKSASASGWVNSSIREDATGVCIGGTTEAAVGRLNFFQHHIDGLSTVVSNSFALGTFKQGVFGLCGSTGYGIPGWPNSFLFENQAKGNMIFSAYGEDAVGDIIFQTANRTERMKIPYAGTIAIPGYTTQSSVKIGAMELQAYSLNNSFVTDNIYFDGANWKYRAAGYGTVLQMYNGDFLFKTASNSSGTASLTTQITIPNAGGLTVHALGTGRPYCTSGLFSIAALTAAEMSALFTTPTTNYLQKYNGTNLANSLIYDNGTNVGIGTTNPGAKLDVAGIIRSNSATPIEFTSLGAGTYTKTVIYYNATDGLMIERARTTDDGGGTIIPFQISQRGGGTSPLYINGSGNVGIGTAAPAYKLHIAGTGTGAQFEIENTTASTGKKYLLSSLDAGGFTISQDVASPIVLTIKEQNEFFKIIHGGTGKYLSCNKAGAVETNMDLSANGFGCNGATPQTAYASGGAVVPGAGAYGFDSAVHAAALATLVTNIRLALVANGIMS